MTSLRKDSNPLVLSQGTALLQYVILMISRLSQDHCRKETVTLLKHLATEDHKAFSGHK